MAHFFALFFGIVAAVVAVEPRVSWELTRALDARELVSRNWERAEVLARSLDFGERAPDDVSLLAISLTIWLVGYASAWMLFRRGWFIWSVFLPSAIFLTSLALDREQPTWPALAFLGLGVVQGVNVTAHVRTGAWTRHGIRSPRGIARWSTIAGVALSAIVVLAGLGAPLTIPDNAQDWVVARSRSITDALLEQADRLPTRDRDARLEGNYSQFTDAFRIGEGVPSGDTPVALLQAASRNYLAARKFDSYDGSGWSTTVGSITETGSSPEPSQAPRIAFSANQPMNLSETVLDNRDDRSGVVTMYQPTDGLMLTLETHQSASVPTAIRVGWEGIDATYAVEDVQMVDVPLDLRSLVGLLRLAEFDPTALSAGSVVLTDPSLQAAVDAERENLRERYPVITELSYDAEQGVLVYAAGRLPVYEDVEAVFYSGDGNQPETYSVTGLQLDTTEADLAATSTDYPDYIAQRYLALPESVTPRTRDLAAQVVNAADATTPVEMAEAVQNHLRTSYDYLVESSLAPDGQDIVDYFLFDRQVGRCDHFASSMVVMLRSLGVPARIVTGLAPVEYDESAGGYLYRGRDAHSWVEVYFSDYGWAPFEPTPSEAPLDFSTDDFEQQGPVEQTPTPESNQSEPDATAEANSEASPVAAIIDGSNGSGGGLVEQTTSFPGVLAPVFMVLAALAVVLALFWLLPLRGLRPGASYFLRFQRLGRFWGVEQEGSMTPGEYAKRYGTVNPRFSRAASSIADAFIDERYGPPDQSPDVASRGLAGWLEVRRSIVSWRPWKKRSAN